jgi:hypothetical protein
MRLGLAIIALLACDFACAQTPLPRSRPQAAAVHASNSGQIVKVVAAVPVPRVRPAEAPAAQHHARPTSGTHAASVPVPRERPAAAMARVVATVQAAMREERKPEPESLPPKSAPVTSAPPPHVTSPHAAPPTAALESPRIVPHTNLPQVNAAPLPPPAAQQQGENQDSGPMEEPVPPLASPPSSVPQITRLEARPAPPVAAPELPKLDPPPGEHAPQVAQLPESLIAILKRLPMPKKRPPAAWPRPDDLVFRDVTAPNPEAECDAALNSGILVAERLQLGRRGGCYVPYAVKVEAIMVGRKRIDIVPPAKLRCGFALAVANWVRADFAPAAASLGASLVGLRQLDSYNCRTMSSTRRLMSEHSMGNALDIAVVILAGHHRAHLTDRHTQKGFRARLRQTACKRFKTVLGPGVPQHHDHIHVDLRHHYGPGGICHWNVL